jgi:hypothetical protein
VRQQPLLGQQGPAARATSIYINRHLGTRGGGWCWFTIWWGCLLSVQEP